MGRTNKKSKSKRRNIIRNNIAGIKKQKVTTGNYNLKSIMKLVDFYEKNSVRLEPVREKMEVDGMPYPQMKMLDMGFWLIGFELDKVLSKKIK